VPVDDAEASLVVGLFPVASDLVDLCDRLAHRVPRRYDIVVRGGLPSSCGEEEAPSNAGSAQHGQVLKDAAS
jgi:hypothetical protein